MATGLNHLHSFNRYFLLIALFYVLYRAFDGWLRRKPFTAADDKASLVLFILAHLQLTIGLIQYIFTSGLTQAAFANMGAAMKDPWLRYFAVEHITGMILAIVLISVGRIASKKAASDNEKHRKLAIYTASGLLIIIAVLSMRGLLFSRVVDVVGQ
jgi:heme A synthase